MSYASKKVMGMTGKTKDTLGRRGKRPPLILALEQRMMFDGVAVGHVGHEAGFRDSMHLLETHGRESIASEHPAISNLTAAVPAATAATTSTSTRDIVFVDTSLPDWQALANAANPGAQVVLLNSSGNEMDQIAQALQGQKDVGAIYILSHGGEGYIMLGGTMVSSANLAQFRSDLNAIGASLAPGGDILLYGCDVALGSDGQVFVNSLAIDTGAVVAASTHSIGVDGGWVLDFATGEVNAPAMTAPIGYNFDLGNTYEVTNLNDSGAGSLRAEVALADGNGVADTIVFDPALFASGAQTITLTSGSIDISGNNSSNSINIIGPGANLLTISGNNASRIFSAYYSTGSSTPNYAAKTLSGMTLTNGKANVNVAGFGLGGAIVDVYSGSLTLNNMIVKNSTASTVGSFYVGGGVAFEGGGGANSFAMSNSMIYGNTSLGQAAGLYAITGSGTGTITVQNSSIFNNTSSSTGGYGGGTELGSNGSGAINVVNVTFDGNTGAAGSGLCISGGTATIQNCTFTGNNSVSQSNLDSGAFFEMGSTVTLNNNIIFGNTASNTAGAAYTASDVFSRMGSISGTHNIIGVIKNYTGQPATVSLTNTITTSPGLGTLAFNGGPVKTVSIASGGSADGGGSSTGMPVTDARGYARDSTNDIGAYAVSHANNFNFDGSLYPANGYIDVPSSQNLVLDFGESVSAVSGKNIVIYNSNGTVFQTIAANNTSLVTIGAGIASNSEITVAHNAFASDASYYVEIDSGAFQNAASMTFNGITNPITWAFTSANVPAPVVSSIDLASASPNNATSEAFTVTFSESVTGVSAADFTAVTTGGLTDSGISITGSGSSYTLTVNGVTGNGTLQLDLTSIGSIAASGTALAGTYNSGQTYTVDQTPPTVSSINRTGSTPNNGSSESYTVTFSENVTGVDSTDFSAVTSGTADSGITVTPLSGSVYTVTINGVTGDGTIGLNLKGSGTGITDLAGNAIPGGGYTGQVYTIDHTPPTVSSITALGSSPNNANSDQFTVTFSESVSGVVGTDFTANTLTGNVADTSISVTPISGSVYTVTVNGVTGDGTLRLDLKSGDSGITDAAGNSATAAYTAGATYTIEHTPPSVSSIVANGSNPNNAGSEQFTVTFTEGVTGVATSDFTATVGGSVTDSGITVTPTSASTYTVTVNGVAGDGTLRLDLNNSGTGITDAASNAISGGYTGGDVYTIEHTPPAVTSVGVPSSATYIAGQNMVFTVNFSEAVVVTGTPEIGITLDTGGTVYAQYIGGTNTSTLTFRYTVVGGESDTNGVTLDSVITANGGTIKDAATNNAVLTLNSVASTAGVLVDSIAPTVTSVGVPSNGTYGAGETLDFTVDFSENVLVTTGGGTPYLNVTLDTGGTVHASYVGGSTTNALTFEYTVVNGNNDSTGVAVGSSITLNGGTIRDAATNAAVLTLNNVGLTTGVLVDAIPPTAISINTVEASTNNLSSEDFTVTFSAPVNGVDASDFTLVGTGSASGLIGTVSGSGTTWHVTVGSVAGDGTLRLDLNAAGDAITDNFGNRLMASHTGDQSYTIEHTPPAVTSVTVPGNATYVAGQNLDFTATFSEIVTVNGIPRIAVTLDTGGTVYADYVSGSGTSTLTFRYTVVAGNQDLTGITTPGSVIDLNGGTIKDAATNAASGSGLNLAGETSLVSVDVDAIVPAVSSVVVPINGTYGTGQDLDFSVNFDKVVTVNTGSGTPYITIALTTGGTVDAIYVSGSNSTTLVFRYVVVSGELDTTGITVGASIVTNGGTIQDSIGNNAATTLNNMTSTTGVLVDSILPTVTSIDTVLAATNNLGTETFTVTFSTDVSLNPPDTTDFSLHNTGTISGTIASVTAVSGSVYTVTVTGVTGDGTMRLDLNTSGSVITDAYVNPLTAAHTGDQTYTIEHTPPSATAMTVPSNGTYGTGQDMDFTVTFNEAVTVDTTGGTPRIAITLDTGGTVYATYLSGSGTGTLTFRYAPTSGVQDLTGIVTGTAIDANGGTIKDAATNNAALAINAVEPSTAGIDVDAILPVVTSVGVPANATYIAGQDLDFTVNLNKNVTVDTTGGTPYITLTLDTGGTVDAQYISGSGTSSLTFRYVVAPANLDMTGVTVGSSIVLNSGTIDDTHNNPAVLTLAGVASTSGVLVDAVPPTVASINSVGSALTNSSSVTYTVTFSEAVTGVNASDFTLTDTGGTTGTIASVTAVSGSVYTVTVNNINGDGTMRLDLNSSGTGIADLATNPIATGYTSGELYTFNHQSPAVVSVGVPTAGTYIGGQNLDFTVTYGTPVILNTSGGEPSLTILLANGKTEQAQLLSAAGNQLIFQYTVAAGDQDLTGISIGSSVNLNGASLHDSFGNAADLTLHGVASTALVDVDAVPPAVTSVQTPAAGTYTPGESLDLVVSFSEPVTVNTAGGTPEIAITLNSGGTVYAHYVSGSGSADLTFSYMVPIGNVVTTGISVSSAIIAHGGSINSADNNVAALTLNNVGSTANVDIGLAPNQGGTGRGLLPGSEEEEVTSSVSPFVWVLPFNNGNEQPSLQVLPTTTQTTWSSVPLLSAGQQGYGHMDASASRGDPTAVGSSGFSTASPSVIEQLVSPPPTELVALTGNNLDRSNNLTWQPPTTIEQPPASDDILGALIPSNMPTSLRDATPVLKAVDARHVAPAEKHAAKPVAPVAPHVTGSLRVTAGGKASLNQQFARYGKTAWERERSVLIDHAERIAQRRAG